MEVQELRHQVFNLETELEMLKAKGVFRLVPQREERSDGKGEWLAFKSRGAVIIDKNIPYVRRLSLPLERNEDKANTLLQKLERTKQAEKLVLQINKLKAGLKEHAIRVAKAAELKRKELEYQSKAAALNSKVIMLNSKMAELNIKATEYTARANVFRNRAAHYAQQAAALQLA